MMVIGISGCTALLVTGFGVQDSIANIANDQYDRIQVVDINVMLSEEVDDSTDELIAEIAGENVMAIHDGIVVFSDYTTNDGYSIVLQHRENLISIYRNCYRLLKQVGDKVYGGEVIGTLSDGSGVENGKKNFLHLELWHRSKPLDPNIYIAF